MHAGYIGSPKACRVDAFQHQDCPLVHSVAKSSALNATLTSAHVDLYGNELDCCAEYIQHVISLLLDDAVSDCGYNRALASK